MHKGDSRVLNLKEVTAYDKDGKVIAPLSTRMSSENSSNKITVGNCHDGTTDDGNFCQSSNNKGDTDPWLVFGYRADAGISKIVVTNRAGNTKYLNRIKDASIRICSDSGPH